MLSTAPSSSSRRPSASRPGSSSTSADRVPLSSGGRKRPRDASSDAGTDSSDLRRVGPLAGVSICLTGLTAERKDELHNLVQMLGGSYTGDLFTTKSGTTHLLADKPHGAKYTEARRFKHIEIVYPDWLEECAARRMLVDTEDYRLDGGDGEGTVSLGETLDSLLASSGCCQEFDAVDCFGNGVFSGCQFYLAGFGSATEGEDKENEAAVLKTKIARLIRRAMGTIYWTVEEHVTHIVVGDECDEEVRTAALACTQESPGVIAVSTRWVVDSFKARQPQPPMEYIPRPKRIRKPNRSTVVPKKVPQSTVDAVVSSASVTGTTRKRKVRTTVFQGAVFACVRPTPPEDAADWDPAELETLVVDNGGHVLSRKILDALRRDAASAPPRDGPPDRICYVVSGGGYTQSHATFHPLLKEASDANLCEIVPVTPVWVRTCTLERREARPDECPLLFRPQPWHIKRLPPSNRIKVAITGFLGTERLGIGQLLLFIGARYTENMKNTNTHLICKEAKGAKYEKAVEWGLHVVNLEWLFYVIRYGNKAGCENEFALLGDAKPVAEDGLVNGKAKVKEEAAANQEKEGKARTSPEGAKTKEEKEQSEEKKFYSTVDGDPTKDVASAETEPRNNDRDVSRPTSAGTEDIREDDEVNASINEDERLRAALKSLEVPETQGSLASRELNPPQRRARRRCLVLPISESEVEDKTEKTTSNVYSQDAEDSTEGTSPSELGSAPLLPSHTKSAAHNDEEADDLQESQVVWYGENTEAH